MNEIGVMHFLVRVQNISLKKKVYKILSKKNPKKKYKIEGIIT